MPLLLLLLSLSLLLSSCRVKQEEKASSMSGIFEKREVKDDGHYDLPQILRSGELIIATLSGPDSYYDYHGMPMGFQYALAENFASSQGLSVRVEVCKDTLSLLDMLCDGSADVIAYPLSRHTLSARHLKSAGYRRAGSWAVRADVPVLAEALDAWYHEGLEDEIQQAAIARMKKSRQVTRHARSAYLSRDRGVISIYDNLFKDAQGVTGWDWRLIAAQCYQESAFDPNARSYVGAQGLMQLMPATAQEMGVKPEEVFLPEKNVDAGARYIAVLTRSFSDIRDPDERIKFVLASYNGGSFHIRDAMALARKHGADPHTWESVAPYVLALQQKAYYSDPVVKYGYMIGSETVNYVQSILQRWRDYGGRVAITHAPILPPEAPAGSADGRASERRTSPKNRFSTNRKILRPEELQQQSAAGNTAE